MQTRGPWYGKQPFDQTLVTVARVGSISFTPTSIRDGVLAFIINGVSNTKHIDRMTLRHDNYNGNYIGMIAYAAEGWPDPRDRGVYNNPIAFSITIGRHPVDDLAAKGFDRGVHVERGLRPTANSGTAGK